MKLKTFAAAMAVLATCGSFAQQFNYSIEQDTVSWQELNAQTILHSGDSSWNPAGYTIPFSEAFEIGGDTANTVVVTPGGNLLFNGNSQRAFQAYNAFVSAGSDSLNVSVVGYDSTVIQGIKAIRIQFKNRLSSEISDKRLSYQVVIFQTGRIEIITGPNNFNPAQDTLTTSIGMVNLEMNTDTCGIMLSGLPETVQVNTLTASAPEIPVLTQIPSQGMRYKFIPVINGN